jgi:hypothetical protein
MRLNGDNGITPDDANRRNGIKAIRARTEEAFTMGDGAQPQGIRPEDCGELGWVVQALDDAYASSGFEGARRELKGILELNRELIRLISGDQAPPKRYTVRWANTALEPLPPIEWRAAGLFQEASVSMVFGDPGSGKTWLMLHLAVCHAMGKSWLGRSTTPGSTLVVDEESGDRRMRRRLGAVMRACGADGTIPLAYTSLELFNMTREDEAKHLQDLITETGAKLVIIDALADIAAGAEENSVKEMQPVLMRLRKIAELTGAAIVVIHHASKGGGYRGSTAIAGALDLLLKVEAMPGQSGDGSTVVEIRSEKTRDVAPIQMGALIRFEESEDARGPVKVFVHEAEIEAKPVRRTSAESYVLGYLGEHPNATVKTIEENATGVCAPSTARKALYALYGENEVVRTDGGGSGVVATFALRTSYQ